MRRFLAVLLWSILAAAFIGPGTVTTAAAAGASHGLALLWALAFSILATLVLQEASARLTIVSGRNLAQAIRDRYRGRPAGMLVLLMVVGAIVLGNAAYQTGNILGAVAGVGLGTDVAPAVATLAIGAVAALLLWLGTTRTVAHVLSLTVAAMGIAFVVTAVSLRPAPGELAASLVVPALPAGAGLLVLALVGTTVVPYNLFLGSGLAAGQVLREVRFGLTVAVLLGGIISMAVLVVGAAIEGPFSFEALAETLARRVGPWAGGLLALGLFAAGFSSATTAPLAAAVTARSLFEDGSGRWSERGWRTRLVWAGVLAVGVGFGLAGVRPIPAIVLAQALNGILLPFAAVFLLLAVNDRCAMGPGTMNGGLSNGLLALVTAVAILLGASNLLRAGFGALGAGPPDERLVLGLAVATALVLSVPVMRAVRARRRG